MENEAIVMTRALITLQAQTADWNTMEHAAETIRVIRPGRQDSEPLTTAESACVHLSCLVSVLMDVMAEAEGISREAALTVLLHAVLTDAGVDR